MIRPPARRLFREACALSPGGAAGGNKALVQKRWRLRTIDSAGEQSTSFGRALQLNERFDLGGGHVIGTESNPHWFSWSLASDSEHRFELWYFVGYYV